MPTPISWVVRLMGRQAFFACSGIHRRGWVQVPKVVSGYGSDDFRSPLTREHKDHSAVLLRDRVAAAH